LVLLELIEHPIIYASIRIADFDCLVIQFVEFDNYGFQQFK